MPRIASVILLIVGLWLVSGTAVNAQQLLVPEEKWNAAYDLVMDVALAVDTAPGVIAVAGNRGTIVYYEDGTQRAVIPSAEPQSAVLIVGDLVISGGETGIAAHSLDGDFVWSIDMAGGCEALELGELGDILALSEGKVSRISLSGTPSARLMPGRGIIALATSDTILVTASPDRISYVRSGTQVWACTTPFFVSDLAIDELGDIWIVGEGSVALLSRMTGSVIWQQPFGGVPSAICILPGRVNSAFKLTLRNSAVITGYRKVDGERDYLTVNMSSEGEVLWRVVHDSGNGDDLAYDVAALDNGDVVVTGSVPLAAGPESGTDYLTIRYSLQPAPLGHIAGVNVLEPPVADFEYSPVTPRSFDPIAFDNRSHDPDGEIVAQTWYFEEYQRSDNENAFHTYVKSGAYDVTLTVIDDDGLSASCTKTVYVANRLPELDWETSQSGGGEGLEADFSWTTVLEQHGGFPDGFAPQGTTDIDDVAFEDLSTGGASLTIDFSSIVKDRDGWIVGYEWSFGDGNTSHLENPTHTYGTSGIYTVRLVATDNEGGTSESTFRLEVGGSGAIATWDWSIATSGSYENATNASSQNPVYWFDDNSEEGPFEVTLTVWDTSGGSSTITKTIDIANVPPNADFGWSFSQPGSLFPSAEELFWMGEGNAVVQDPSIPSSSGVISFDDLSADGEPWLAINEWEWDFDGNWEGWACENCETEAEPQVVLTWGGEGGGEWLFRGTRQVTLLVWDDDGEGGENGFSNITQNVTVANIPPYAGYEWWHEEWGSWVNTDCSGGDTWAETSNGPFTVSREVQNWNSGDAVFTPWNYEGQVALSFEGSGTVQVSEVVPVGWSINYWGEELTVEGNTLSGTIDLGEGGAMVFYDLYAPNDESASEGTEAIAGNFVNEVGGEGEPETYEVSIDSDVVLCLTVDVDTSIEFYAYGDEDTDTGHVDLNGDSVDFDWDFGIYGTDSGQSIMLWLTLNDLTAQYDGWDWIWQGQVNAALTVTDVAGGSTTASDTLEIEGTCNGGGGE